ncbi:MAG: TonB family protein [Candidatus Aegiribacteria sp.]|nr:TonB family protein [Candidatus Aegiribacteria sp.]
MISITLCLFISLFSQVSTVDEAIELYLMGDMNNSIIALEDLMAGGSLSLDEQIRAYHRLGAAYFGIGEYARMESAFYSLLQLDPYYDLGPWENPQLRRLLDNVKQESMSTVLVQGEPAGALVFMNGEYAGSAPYIKDNLLSGRTYTFTIIADGYETVVQSCTTVPGQLHTMTYQMDPVSISTEIALPDTASTGEITDPITVSSQGTPSSYEQGMHPDIISPDTSITNNSSASGTMTIDQLNSLLYGGVQMTSLGGVGPLSTDAGDYEVVGTSQGLVGDHTRFGNTGGTIEMASESQARMVFSDVNFETENVLQTDPGYSYRSRTASEVREVLTSKESAVIFIYNKHLRADPLLSGTVLIEMIIEPSGRVSNVSILDSTTMNPAFDLELASAAGTWRFGAVDENEGHLPVIYPFHFSR